MLKAVAAAVSPAVVAAVAALVKAVAALRRAPAALRRALAALFRADLAEDSVMVVALLSMSATTAVALI